MAIGLNDPVLLGIPLYALLMVFGFLLVIGLVLWAMRVKGMRDLGRGMSILSVIVLIVLVIAMAVQPAQVGPIPGEAEFEVLSVSAVGGANYSIGSKTFTVAATVNKTSHVIAPTTLTANFSVQRGDAGQTTDVKTVTASVAQTTRTDPTTGLSYKAIASNAYGIPNLDWVMVVGGASTSATDTLTAQMGLTPFQTGVFNMTINWNGYAFTTSDVAVNDVIYAGTLTIGSETFTVQVVIKTVNT